MIKAVECKEFILMMKQQQPTGFETFSQQWCCFLLFHLHWNHTLVLRFVQPALLNIHTYCRWSQPLPLRLVFYCQTRSRSRQRHVDTHKNHRLEDKDSLFFCSSVSVFASPARSFSLFLSASDPLGLTVDPSAAGGSHPDPGEAEKKREWGLYWCWKLWKHKSSVGV